MMCNAVIIFKLKYFVNVIMKFAKTIKLNY